MGDWVTGNLLDAVLVALAAAATSALDTLWGLLSATVFVSPNVTEMPQVVALADTCLDVVNVCYVLAFLWTALQIMGRDTLQSRVGPGELVPRLIIGLIAANFSQPICSTAIQLANALTAALTSQSITSPKSMQQLHDLTMASLGTGKPVSDAGILLVLIGLLIAVLVGVLIVQWIIRLGVLVVAVGIAPIALALHGTPQTEGAAKLWWRTLLGALGTVVLQAVALHTTLTIFLDPAANLPMLGLPGEPGAVMNLLIVVCLLWAVIKIPALMRRYVTQPKPSGLATIARVVLVQQLTRSLRRIPGTGRPSGGGGTRIQINTWPMRSGRSGSARSLPRPAGAAPGRVGVAYPTGRSVRPYTREELARGVDPYTRALKTRRTTGGTTPRRQP
ncbi:conjugal transfer protein TrbL family protein [Cryptosporangium minutisporangium]|uniref:Integral membrane protein n=1 Tax=Cryptosporangium minutisporangium TaxID=113569 RepID=A0ABP6SZZ8_9ACTN